MKLKPHILFFALSAALFAGCSSDEFDQPDYYNYDRADTKLSEQLVYNARSYVGHVKSSSEVTVTRGVTLLRLGYLNQKGLAMQMFVYKVNLGAISIRVSLPDDQAALGAAQLLTDQAAAIESKSVYTVWGAISGGGFGTNNQPNGILYANGQALKDQMGTTPAFFAILNDGQAVCLPASEFAGIKSRIREAVSGDARLVGDGYLLTNGSTTLAGRSAVGVSKDGNEVYLVVVDGGDFYYSNGITYDDLGLVMKSCGAHEAISLDYNRAVSPRPVTAVWRNERVSTLFDLLNLPYSNGLAEAIPNGLVIVER